MSDSSESPAEFSIINVLRERCAGNRADVLIGIGDDGAVTSVPPGYELVIATDALVEGTHFLPGAAPASLGHRCLAVNLSDLAAMGAAPQWATLSLALPKADISWVRAFADGFGRLAEQHNVSLIGGDTVRGPLSVSVTVMGIVPAGEAVTRAGARPGDDIYLTGHPGRAGAGCLILAGDLSGGSDRAQSYIRQFEFPEPRVALGPALLSLATAMIDVSDGVNTDLARLLAASSVGATASIPDLGELQVDFGAAQARELFLGGGEDYELCFTAPAEAATAITSLAGEHGINIARIGIVTEATGLHWSQNGVDVVFNNSGFEHFRD